MQVIMKAVTWSRDSHGLFDYESRHVEKATLKATETCKLIRQANEIQIINQFQEKDLPEESKFLTSLNYQNGTFSINVVQSPNGNQKNSEKLWLVVRSLKSNNGSKGYRLAEGDVIKLGRVKFRIREIQAKEIEKLGAPPKPLSAIMQFALGTETEVSASEEGRKNQKQNQKAKEFVHALPCRICLENAYERNNPLISPCKCAGTMKYIHLKCLQLWLKNRLTTRQSGNSISFYWKTLDCELCKRAFPNSVGLEGKLIELLEIPKPDSQYIILEALCRDKNSSRGIHVISLNLKNSIKLGRGHDADVRISDISVSRSHALIRIQQNSFYLEDSNSKFGTLIQIKRPIALDPKNQIAIQVGRTVITFALKKPWSFLPACFRSGSDGIECLPQEVIPVNSGIPLSGIEIHKQDSSNNLLHNHHELGKNSSCEEEEEVQVEDLQIEEILDVESQQAQINLNNVINRENITSAIAENNAVIGDIQNNVTEINFDSFLNNAEQQVSNAEKMSNAAKSLQL